MIISDKRRFYSVDSNKALFELPLEFGDDDTKCESWQYGNEELVLFRLSADKYVFYCSGNPDEEKILSNTFLVTASSAEAVPISNSFKLRDDNPYAAARYRQFNDGSLLVTDMESDQAFHVGTDGTASEILDSAQWERLLHSDDSHFGAVNYLNNQFYVQTTDEILTMDITGKSVKKLEVEPVIASLAIDATKVKWIAWQSPDDKYKNSVTLTTGALPDESENTD